MKTIVLNGQLGKLFGKRHRLSVATAAEAVRALVANHPGIERLLIETKGVGYRIRTDADLALKELHHPAGGGRITITPVIMGAGGNGFGQILLGAAIIGAAFLTGGAALAFAPTVGLVTTTLGSLALGIGASLILGGVAQMISPTPKAEQPAERPENMPSYTFNGPVNTTAQGQPVPVGYGRLIVGGAVISAGITTEEIPI